MSDIKIDIEMDNDFSYKASIVDGNHTYTFFPYETYQEALDMAVAFRDRLDRTNPSFPIYNK